MTNTHTNTNLNTDYIEIGTRRDDPLMKGKIEFESDVENCVRCGATCTPTSMKINFDDCSVSYECNDCDNHFTHIFRLSFYGGN